MEDVYRPTDPFDGPPSSVSHVRETQGEGWPAYTSDPAAAWRLLERMPRKSDWPPPTHSASTDHLLGFDLSTLIHPETDARRMLAEAAAILAVRGVEPREVAA